MNGFETGIVILGVAFVVTVFVKFTLYLEALKNDIGLNRERLDGLKGCTECGVLVDKEKIQKVQTIYGNNDTTEYYCDRHKKPYDICEMYGGTFGTLDLTWKFYIKNPKEHQEHIEVTVEGKVIKKK